MTRALSWFDITASDAAKPPQMALDAPAHAIAHPPGAQNWGVEIRALMHCAEEGG